MKKEIEQLHAAENYGLLSFRDVLKGGAAAQNRLAKLADHYRGLAPGAAAVGGAVVLSSVMDKISAIQSADTHEGMMQAYVAFVEAMPVDHQTIAQLVRLDDTITNYDAFSRVLSYFPGLAS